MLMTAAIVTALLSTTAVAYTLQNAGFSATHYAAGFSGGPNASAWDGNVLWSVDPSDGLYKADAGPFGPGPLTSISATRVNSSVFAGLVGVAVGLDGRLYAADSATNEILELDKTDGHVIRSLVPGTNTFPRAIATDPLSGSLIVAGASRVWRIAMPATTPAATIYTTLPGGAGTTAIAIGPDGTMFVVNVGGQISSIESTTLAATHTGPANVTPMGAPVTGIDGVAVITNGVTTDAEFLMVSTNTGAVYKVSGLASTVSPILVLDGAGAGQQIAIGPDRCAYPSMGTEVIRVADATGACALALAGIIPPALSLANVTGQDAHINDGIQTVRATLTNASSVAGQVVTFTITGVNARTVQVTTDAGGSASIAYTSAVMGLDTIVATAMVDGFPTTSNPVTIDWLRETDTKAPTIGFSYTVPAGGTGTPFNCDTTITSATASQVTCGWFTKYPTIHFDPTANGPSGLSPTASCGDFTLDYQPGPEGHHQTCSVKNGDGDAQATLTVVIDAVASPPTITASATANAAPYTAGTLTRGPVTVHFTCGSPILTGLTCPADQVFAGTGTYNAAGSSTDIAGQTSSTTFGPIDIDTTPPVVGVDAAPYSFGDWTNADVHLVFQCSDNFVVALCPGPQTVVTSTTGVTVLATDSVGNTTSFTTGAINIDRTPPTIAASATTADGKAYVAGTLTNQGVTVHFTCGTDAAPISTCASDQTFHASGSATGSATDVAGNTASTTFGPIAIDTTPPTISAAVTVSGAPYDGGWTRGPVLVRFTCTDENPGVVCPADVTLAADQNASVSGTAHDAAGNGASVTTAAIKIDVTPPVTSATITGTLGAPNTYLFAANVSLAATDGGSGVASITYRVDGGAPVTIAGASAAIAFNTEGSHSVTFSASDTAGNVETEHGVTFAIIFRQHTTLTITSPSLLATGTPVSARLVSETGANVAGEIVSFTAGAVTRTATTNASGIASVDLGLAPGAYSLTASYAGTDRYFPSDAAARPTTVYAMTRFVVYAPDAVLGAIVQFYGGDWSKQIDSKVARKGFEDFKGYSDGVQGGMWTARSGDATKPPKTVPEYIGVILTTSASKTKETITGDVAGTAVVRVSGGDDPKKPRPYDGKLGERGFGTVIGRS